MEDLSVGWRLVVGGSMEDLLVGRWSIAYQGHRGQNSGRSRLVEGLESAVAAQISRCN